MNNKLQETYRRLKAETEVAWKAQLALVDEIMPVGRTEPMTEAEAEAIRAATILATDTEAARGVAYRDWQESLSCRHDWVTHTTGSVSFVGGELIDDLHDVEVCRLCGCQAEEASDV